MPNKWIILDAMGVVFEEGDDNDMLLVPYVQRIKPELTREEINERYYAATCGEISSKEFWDRLGLGDRYPQIETDYLDSQLKLDPECTDIVSQLRSSYSFAMISNDVAEWSRHLRKRFGLDRLFEVAIISGEVHARKPDKRIYEIALGETDAEPADCVMVDDKLKNLCNASDMGIRTIHFFRKKLITDTPPHDFSPGAEIRSFRDLPDAVERVFSKAAPQVCYYGGD